jgi:hypothetical protein
MDPRPHRCRRVCALLLLALMAFGCQQGDRLPNARDAIAVTRLLRDAGIVGAELEKRPEFWARSSDAPLGYDERAWLLPLFASFVDEDLALGSYADRFLSNRTPRNADRDIALVRAVGLGSYARQLRERLRLLSLIGENTSIFAALDEGSPEHGIAKGQLTRIAIETARPDAILKLDLGIDALRESRPHLSKVGAAPSELNVAWQLLKDKQLAEMKGKQLSDAKIDKLKELDVDPLVAGVADAAMAVALDARVAYRKSGGKLLHFVIGAMLGNEIAGIIDPLVADIALWLGDTRLRDGGAHLISEELLDSVQPLLEPGDLIVERRNWYLSNLGLPGFWPHAALHIGSPAELAAWADDEGVRALFPAGLTAHLAEASPDAWAAYNEQVDEQPMRVIEAVSEGVVVASLHHSCLADHVAFMRPRRSKAERAFAISEAFRHFGKPYDFDFDFQTISALVCSELVYNAYDLPAAVGARLRLTPLPTVVGRVTLPPNDIVARFDAEYGTEDQQLDFVAFLDGDETSKTARAATVQDLRSSWLRPKWDLNQ